MDPQHFIIVAGQEAHDRWNEDLQARLAKGQDLCRIQEEQYACGLVTVEICPSLHGWSVRYGSGLQGFDLLASPRRGQLDGSRSDAIQFATEWVAKSPTERYAWMRRTHEKTDERHPFGEPGPALEQAPRPNLPHHDI